MELRETALECSGKKNMKHHPIVACMLFLFTVGCSLLGSDQTDTRVIASVASVDYPRFPSEEHITVAMIIHAPSSFLGARMTLATESASRMEIRKKYPIGSLLSLEIPRFLVLKLFLELQSMQSVERQIDSGISPVRISTGIPIVSFALSDLSSLPKPYIATSP